MISQKTVSKLDAVLRRLFFFRRSERTLPLWTWKAFRRALYERGFNVHALDYLEQEYGGNPSRFLPLIHNGTIPAYLSRADGSGEPVPNEEDQKNGQLTLCVMIEVVIPYSQTIPDHVERPTPRELSAQVIASLREDGLDFIGGKVVPAEMKSVNLKKEDEYLIGLIRAIGPPNMDEIQHHHDESEKAFANGGWGAASSEARNFLVATLRGLRESATTRGKVAPYKQPGKDGSLIEDFKTIGLFTDAEKDAVMHVWVLLSHAGPHVGIKEEDSARLSRLMAIGMTEWIALKFIGWEKNGFKSF
jgi:hypothetical protein